MVRRMDLSKWSVGLMALVVVAMGIGSAGPGDVFADAGHQVFVRGGFAGMNSDRQGEIFTDTLGASGKNDNSTGWYFGAGLDLLMHKDFLGMNGVSLLGEIGLEFKRWQSERVAQGAWFAATGGLNGGGVVVQDKVQLTMLTVDIAPKLKFMDGSRLRPWIIPVGVDFHVISPPSNQTQYLDIGVQFGAGVEYNLWGPFNIGLDGRYHLAANLTNTVNNFGTIGGYVGIGF